MNDNQGEEYVSDSSIDREPREPKVERNGQAQLFDADAHEGEVREYLAEKSPGEVAFSLTLQIEGSSFKNTIKFGRDKIPAEQFEEILLKQLKSEYFLQQIRGICGEQRPPEPAKEPTTDRPVKESLIAAEEREESEGDVDADAVQAKADGAKDDYVADQDKEQPGEETIGKDSNGSDIPF